MAEHTYAESDLGASRAAPPRSFGGVVRSGAAPEGFDDLERFPEYDFGPLRVRVPAEAQLRMADPDALYSDAAFFVFPDGTVRLSVLAAPREGRLWPERAEEIATMQANLGAGVRAYSGEWGQELQITDDGATNWVIGVDGPRWMLLGRSSCSDGVDGGLVETMRDMIRSSRVFRGNEALPARTPLPLRSPGTFDTEHEATDRTGSTPYTGVITLVLPKIDAPVADDPGDRPRRTGASGAAVPDPRDGAAHHSAATTIWASADRASAHRPTPDPAFASRVPPTSRSDHRATAVGSTRAGAAGQDSHDEVSRARLDSVRHSEPTAPRSRVGLLAAAALVLLAAAAAVVLTERGSPPDTWQRLASPQQVNSTQQPGQTPRDGDPATPTPPRSTAPAPEAAWPLAAGPALGAALPVPAAPSPPPVMTPAKSNPAPGTGAANRLTNAARPTAPDTTWTSVPPVTGPSRSEPARQTASKDQTRRSKSRPTRNDRTQGDGLIGALSNDVLGVGPG
jgi:hypothetical protein